MVKDSLGRLVEKPQYGGTLTIARLNDIDHFGPHLPGKQYISRHWSNDPMMMVDYSKGPTGSGETSAQYYLFPKRSVLRGVVVESWELADDVTLIYHIRQGIHFWNQAPANGREADAYDVEASLRKVWKPGYYNYYNYPEDRVFGRPVDEAITALDKWTVQILAKSGWAGTLFEKTAMYPQALWPKEVLDEELDYFSDYNNAIGSGSFKVTDHVPMSSITLTKNADYWDMHPLFPDDQMPYVNSVRILVIEDTSTRLAGLRSGKIDWLGGMSVADGAVSWEDAATLLKINPELQSVERLINYGVDVCMRQDIEDSPFADIRVRKALNMAVDRQYILDTFHGGRGALLCLPIAPIADLQEVFTPLKDLPADVREIYEYNPTKAKQLLADAGYPDGFKTSITCWSAQVDMLSIVKEYFADVGVDMELDQREQGVWRAIGVVQKSYTEMYAGAVSSNGYSPWWWGPWSPGGSYNYSMVNDSNIVDRRQQVEDNYWDEPTKFAIYKEGIPYMLGQAYYVPLPDPVAFTFWQPWLKLYSGELDLGYYVTYTFGPYVWIDQDLKYDLTGRR